MGQGGYGAFLAVLAVLALLPRAAVADGPIDAPRLALESGLIGGAHTAYIDRARKGDAEAQYRLGLIYAGRLEVDWRGEPQSSFTALYWLTQAGHRGHVDAMKRLISMYSQGVGIAPDSAKAKQWQEALVRRLTPPPEKEKPDLSLYKVELVDRDNAILTVGPGADLAKLSRELKQMLEMRRNLPPIRSY